jgi:hypothetical protein
MISQYESCILRGVDINLDGEGLGVGFFEFKRVSDHEIGVLRIDIALHGHERVYLIIVFVFVLTSAGMGPRAFLIIV